MLIGCMHGALKLPSTPCFSSTETWMSSDAFMSNFDRTQLLFAWRLTPPVVVIIGKIKANMIFSLNLVRETTKSLYRTREVVSSHNKSYISTPYWMAFQYITQCVLSFGVKASDTLATQKLDCIWRTRIEHLHTANASHCCLIAARVYYVPPRSLWSLERPHTHTHTHTSGKSANVSFVKGIIVAIKHPPETVPASKQYHKQDLWDISFWQWGATFAFQNL